MELFGLFAGLVFIAFIISIIRGIIKKLSLNRILKQFNRNKISQKEAIEKTINILVLKKSGGKYSAHPESRSNKKYKNGFRILKEIVEYKMEKINLIKEIEKQYERLNEVSERYWSYRSGNLNRPVGSGANFSARAREKNAEMNFQPIAERFNKLLRSFLESPQETIKNIERDIKGDNIKIDDSKERLNKLLQDLKSQDPSIRREASLSLGEFENQKAKDALVLMLKDTDEFVRVNSAISLGRIGDSTAIDHLSNAKNSVGQDVQYHFDDAISSITKKDNIYKKLMNKDDK